MRGEDTVRRFAPYFRRGSPPHARGRPTVSESVVHGIGITPACAGKTFRLCVSPTATPDHPRMRGEDDVRGVEDHVRRGSPPHARGRRSSTLLDGLLQRITPACAGKTHWIHLRGGLYSDHPRMRGEDGGACGRAASGRGSPPHARGRHRLWKYSIYGRRITPACAGKTPTPSPSSTTGPDHPRMRGEDGDCSSTIRRAYGSPPHARGRR